MKINDNANDKSNKGGASGNNASRKNNKAVEYS